jgi:hypothetical protein
MALLPLDNFLCWKLKIATMVIAYYICGAALLAAVLEILDVVSLGSQGAFEIGGGFRQEWRAHVWEGWLACNQVMFFTHLLMIGYSVLVIVAIKRFPTYYEFLITKWYLVLFIIYILIEMGTGIYKYSWYAGNTFRLGYLVFTFIYWILRTIINIVGCIVIYSRISEVGYEIKYGEKRDLSGWLATAIDGRSGMATPRSGLVTPGRSGTTTPKPPPQGGSAAAPGHASFA